MPSDTQTRQVNRAAGRNVKCDRAKLHLDLPNSISEPLRPRPGKRCMELSLSDSTLRKQRFRVPHELANSVSKRSRKSRGAHGQGATALLKVVEG